MFFVLGFWQVFSSKSCEHEGNLRISTQYAQTLILVKLIVVKIIDLLVITRNPVGISGPY